MKTCLICFKKFKVPQYRLGIAKYCSYKCLYQSRKGQQVWRLRKRSYKGELNPAWLGDKVGYGGIHIWINKQFGKAKYCTNDKTHTAKRFEWANISGTYDRNIDNYIQLCKPCHAKFDMVGERMSMIRRGQETLKYLTKFYKGKRTEPTYIHEKRYRYAFS